MRRIASAVCSLLGLCGFLYCTLSHVCCGGHMAHPPYAWWDYLVDVLFGFLFIAAIVASVGSNLPGRKFVLAGLAVMGASRAAGSLAGFLVVPVEAPAFLVVAALSIHGFFRRTEGMKHSRRRARVQ